MVSITLYHIGYLLQITSSQIRKTTILSFMKRLLWISVIFLLAFATFYFWASSNTLNEEDYSQIIDYKASPISTKDTLSIVTYNIGYFSGMTNNLAFELDSNLYHDNGRKAVSLFQKYHPDFVGFQEIDFDASRSFHVNQLNLISESTGYDMGVQAINWDKSYVPFPYGLPSVNYGQIVSGQAVLSKYPISSAERIVLERPDNPFYYDAFYINRLIQIARIQIGEKQLIIVNVHLEAYNKEVRERQAAELLEVYRKYAKDYPVLLVGDFNAQPPFDSEEIESTTAIFFNEPNVKAAVSMELYNASRNDFLTFDSQEPFQKIDYIFYSSGKIQALSAEVLKEAGEISDHLPVMMQFVLKD